MDSWGVCSLADQREARVGMDHCLSLAATLQGVDVQRNSLIWTKVDLTWREVLEDVGGEILGDDHHLAPGSTQVAILVLVLKRKVLKVLQVMEFL